MLLKSKRTIFLILIILLVGTSLFFLLGSSNQDESKKMGLLQVNAKDHIAQKHFKKNIKLENKSSLLPKPPAHPVSKNINELTETIDSIIDTERLYGAILGISVRSVDEGTLIYTNQADTRLIPASNMKVITSIAALEVLGHDYQFSTEINLAGSIKKGVLNGDLYLVGKGDPTLQKEDFDELAKELREKGITKITGSIIADDSWYDDVRYSQDLNWTDEYNYTGNAISALTASPNDDFLSGSVIVDIYPADKVGDKPEVVLTPETDYITIINNGNTVEANQTLTLSDQREHGTNNLIIEGDIPMNSQHYQRWRSVWDPTGYALDLFLQSLQDQGIIFDHEAIKKGVAPLDAENLVTRKSIPLQEIIIPFMKLSNNGLGEVFVKEMGKVVENEGSWERGLEVMEESIRQLGMQTDEVVFRDGSGMSHKNLVSSNFFSDILVKIKDRNWFTYFENSLPVAGEFNNLIGGTLGYRMTDDSTKGNVKAKTGTLKGVSTLSGYVTTKDGEELVFSILINNYMRGAVTDIQDQIVTVLAESTLN